MEYNKEEERLVHKAEEDARQAVLDLAECAHQRRHLILSVLCMSATVMALAIAVLSLLYGQ